MKYFEFIDEMAKRVKMCFDKEVSVEVHKVVKNNSMEYDSLIINEPGRNVTPNFYLQGMYSRYVDGIGLDSLVSEIVQKYESAYDSEKYENLSLDYADCQEKIVMRLISFEKNKKMLEEAPYIPFLDMAVVFYFLADNDQNGIASIRITNEIMNDWKTDVKELYTLASDNSKRIFEEKVMPMSKMFEEFNIDISKIRSEKANQIYEERSEPYVVTNNIGINGASVILYPDMLREIAAKLGGDFYVLPSSIHEVLVVSASEDVDEKSLKKMVEDINRNYLLPDEYLSDNVYKYNLIYNSLEMIA